MKKITIDLGFYIPTIRTQQKKNIQTFKLIG